MKNHKQYLDHKVNEFNHPDFIINDPVSIPHRFTKKQDIEIAGFFAAIFAWGQRKTIINKSLQMLDLMDYAPHDFILNHKDTELKRFLNFKHRTFNATDTLYFISFFKHFYNTHSSLEEAFLKNYDKSSDEPVADAIRGFYNLFFSLPDHPQRTKKHIATPEKGSTCKRINMFLRWMVRNDNKGVDFGIWKQIDQAHLICPVDVHSGKVARALGLLKRQQSDWSSALELTKNLRKLDHTDPVKYDFALFGIGVNEQLSNV